MIKKPEWWPKNPYPGSVFTLTDREYLEAVPNDLLRTRISGFLGRYFWDAASEAIFEAYEQAMQAMQEDEIVHHNLGCPCLYADAPCSANCSCAFPHQSGGCRRCCYLGSLEQKKERANILATAIDKMTCEACGQVLLYYQGLCDSCLAGMICDECGIVSTDVVQVIISDPSAGYESELMVCEKCRRK